MRADPADSRKLAALFLLLSGVPLALLGWLAWRLIDQDRALESQRLRERLDNDAVLIARELEGGLSSWDDLLANPPRPGSTPVPPGVALLIFDAHGVVRHDGVPLPFYPRVASGPQPADQLFAAAEAQEFRENDCEKASVSYRTLAASSNLSVRAGALVRLARCLRKSDRVTEALAVYGELANLASTVVSGAPSELLARRQRIALFKNHDQDAWQRETALLASALLAGRFDIDHATFSLYAESLAAPLQSTPGTTLAEATETLWDAWQQQPTGRTTLTLDGTSVVAVWRTTATETTAIVGDIDTLMKARDSLLQDLHLHLSLEDSSGRPVWGHAETTDLQVTKTFRETGLPWTIHVSRSNQAATYAALNGRRNLWIGGFALMAFVIVAASYVVFRGVNRELRVAQLQSDFVSAVSHEFRTPLTAMRHLTEMLEDGAVSADRVPTYYRALSKETGRLQATVENLLDFGRLESGRRTYRLEEVRVSDLAAQVVDEFHGRTTVGPHRVNVTATPEPANWLVRADREALSLALRNLLDNAIKYSPEDSTVHVAVERHDGLAGISVQDEGAGIPKDEQRAVFRKFVRGEAARTLNVKGTGIGLTMADQIVRAHGGRLQLASGPGQGTRFTILLPLWDGRG